ncbi:MAG: phosphoenolpyruvate synthase, partial [Calditrichaeota bacterium]
MTVEEKALVEELEVKQTKIFVPTNEIDLTGTELRDLKSVRATDSGKICGPKAANLGQLKSLFPDKVPPGLVIPFAVFRRHLDQPMPGTDSTYWQFLQQSFRQADKENAQGQKAAEVERRLLARLARLHEAIREMPFLPEFKRSLQQKFRQIFGVALGELPIFIRSDTNMEDLENFTGAGLNLTVVNVLEKEAILQAIRDVWASPFTERSSRWRRKYLTNPENVYPSLLLLPSVNVDKSGVMITSGLSTSNPADITVAFNWGVGGAVAGQAAETYLLRHDGVDVLLSPARQPEFVYLPLTGGKEIRHAHFHKPILNRAERHKLRVFAAELRSVLPGTPGIKTAG